MGVSVKTKAVTTAKPGVASKPKVKGGVLTEEQALVNEAAQINAKLEELEVPAMMKRLDEIKKVFQAKAKDLPQDGEAIFEGTTGRMVFSKARVEIEIDDKPLMIKMLGQNVFNDAAKMTLTDLKKYLSEGELAKFSHLVYGSRTCKLIESI